MSDFDETGIDYVGDETGIDYVGAAKRGIHPTHARRLQAIALAGRLPKVFLGFDSTVNSATTSAVTAEPVATLRPVDLIVRSSNVEDFQFGDLKVGRVDMIVGSSGVPASMFAPNANRPVISSPPLQAGTNATLNTTNLTNANSRLLAALVCLDISKDAPSP